jgi:hypothetical protein
MPGRGPTRMRPGLRGRRRCGRRSSADLLYLSRSYPECLVAEISRVMRYAEFLEHGFCPANHEAANLNVDPAVPRARRWVLMTTYRFDVRRSHCACYH